MESPKIIRTYVAHISFLSVTPSPNDNQTFCWISRISNDNDPLGEMKITKHIRGSAWSINRLIINGKAYMRDLFEEREKADW